MLSLVCKLEINPPRGLKHFFQLAKRYHVRHFALGSVNLAAGCRVQHPQRHFSNPEGLHVFQAAARHCLATLHQRGMHPNLVVAPGMPWIMDVSKFPNMGVVLRTCITPNETIKGKRTSCYSQALSMNLNRAATPYLPLSAWGPTEVLWPRRMNNLTIREWHRAAFYGTRVGVERNFPWGSEPPGPERGHFDFERWDLSPVNAFPADRSAFGVQGLLANGWEWTSSLFEPFAGFRPFPFYKGYSADFFDGMHYVLKGGSPRTARCMLRRSFRNWFQRHYSYVYAGFRCAGK
jgi:hypothetical protein